MKKTVSKKTTESKTLSLTGDDIREAVVHWLKQKHREVVKPDQIMWEISHQTEPTVDYDVQELDGATIQVVTETFPKPKKRVELGGDRPRLTDAYGPVSSVPPQG